MVRQHMANTLKNCHSPAGMTYSLAGVRLTNLTDCPGCKYGTLDRKKHGMKCADCGKEYTIEELHRLGVLSNDQAHRQPPGGNGGA